MCHVLLEDVQKKLRGLFEAPKVGLRKLDLAKFTHHESGEAPMFVLLPLGT